MLWLATIIGVIFLIRNIRKAKKNIKDWEEKQNN